MYSPTCIAYISCLLYNPHTALVRTGHTLGISPERLADHFPAGACLPEVYAGDGTGRGNGATMVSEVKMKSKKEKTKKRS